MKNFLLIGEIDKANHVIVGYLLYCIAYLFMPWYMSILLVGIVGASKEAIDMLTRKKPYDVKDLLYTIAGAIPSLIISII